MLPDDNGQWTLDDHTIMHTQCGSYFNGNSNINSNINGNSNGT